MDPHGVPDTDPRAGKVPESVATSSATANGEPSS
jgi:hypothetical protein